MVCLYRLLSWIIVMVLFVAPAIARTTVRAESQAPAQQVYLYLPLVQKPCLSLLQDGGFEGGFPNAFWSVTSNVGSVILDNTPTPAAHSGNWKAWLGGANSVTEKLWQTIVLPSPASPLTLNYWWQVSTSESVHPSDNLKIQILDQNGNLLEELDTRSDGDVANSWQQSSKTSATSYGAQTIQLALVANTDADSPTSFLIDDLALFQGCTP